MSSPNYVTQMDGTISTQPSSTTTAPAPTAGPGAGVAPPLDTTPVSSSGNAPLPAPEMADPQQAATAPGTGGIVQSENKLPFKEQVNGYAKKFAGTFFGNKDEKEFGEAKLRGEHMGGDGAPAPAAPAPPS